MVADVRLAELDDGRRVVVKASPNTFGEASGELPGSQMVLEAEMLQFLARHTALPVPRVIHVGNGLLILEFLQGRNVLDDRAERHAAALLAELHAVTPATVSSDVPATAGDTAGAWFGFDFDTLIGPLAQVNTWSSDWPSFYRDERLGAVLAVCRERGRLRGELAGRVERLREDLGSLLAHAPSPGLLHGDVWSGNVLAEGGLVSGFLDPAIYFGDPEVELAFIELFSTFGPAFFDMYEELRPIQPGYHELRRDIYQLYPLLVHVALFGGGYLAGVEERLSRLGY